jgi:prepilin-type N-terminal cleavage/methylation domain-containing protein/prepilin-type processing-associated H-X9-DG protein
MQIDPTSIFRIESVGTSMRPGRTGRQYGFTLVELLVVIAIVAILAALLLPALKNAKAHANAVVCISNLRQIHVALVNYGLDHEDHFPPDGWWEYALESGSYSSNANTGKGYVGSPDATNTPNHGLAGAGNYNLRRWRTFRCPGEPGYYATANGAGSLPSGTSKKITLYDFVMSSYGFNWDINRYGGINTRRWGDLVPQNLPDGMAGTPLVMDGDCIWFQTFQWSYRCFYPEQYSDTLTEPQYSRTLYSYRHPGNRVNIVYADGHVGSRKHFAVTGQKLQTTWLFGGRDP